MPKHEAFDQARRELGRADASLKALNAAKTFEEANQQWENFLAAIDRFFNKLSYAGKDKGKVKGLIDRVKHARKTDDLLHYLMQARNVHEHTIAMLTQDSPHPLMVAVPTVENQMIAINKMVIRAGKVVEFSGENLTFQEKKAGINVVSVKDRSGNLLRPPVSHMGAEIRDLSPMALGELALRFYHAQLSDLEAL